MNSVGPSKKAALSSRIKEEAQRLGFGLVGISPVAPPPREQFFAQWLRAGFAEEFHPTENRLKRPDAPAH